MPLLPMVQRAALRKGMAKGNGTLVALGVSVWGVRKVSAMAQRRTEVLIREELKPGQRIIIANGRATLEDAQGQTLPLTEVTKRGRKRSRRASQTDPS